MERIQAALDKARAAREAQVAPGAPRARAAASPRHAAVAAPDAGTDAMWAKVPRAELRPKRLRSRRIVAFEGGGAAAEFDRLRTRILQKMTAEGWTRLGIVSPTAQNGKSTVAANLAFSIARQSHLRAMLLELDLRRPGLGFALGLPRSLDLSRVLAGEGALGDHAVRLRENLIAGPSRPVPGGAAEFLQDPAVLDRLDGIARDYAPSVMLFDMPPMIASDDVIGFLSNVDCAVIVAAAGTTTLSEIDVCEREVAERTSVLGVVLNKCRFESRSRGYDYA